MKKLKLYLKWYIVIFFSTCFKINLEVDNFPVLVRREPMGSIRERYIFTNAQGTSSEGASFFAGNKAKRNAIFAVKRYKLILLFLSLTNRIADLIFRMASHEHFRPAENEWV